MFVLQVTLGAVLFFFMDDVQLQMVSVAKSAIIHYQTGDNLDRDNALNYLQSEVGIYS